MPDGEVCATSGLFTWPSEALPPSLAFSVCVRSSPDLPVEAESGDAAVPVAVVAAAAAAPVQPGERAPEDAAGRAADGAPEAAAASAGGPPLLRAGHGARQEEGPEGRRGPTRLSARKRGGHYLDRIIIIL